MSNRNIGVILVAGGTGGRMQSPIPKQFLPLKEKPVVLHSFELFMSLHEVVEIVVVCLPEYRPVFTQINPAIALSFALPGTRRQDSVYNGLQALGAESALVCVHDSARPCITQPLVQRVISAAREHGAATAGMPVKFTVKECNHNQFVTNTPDRSFFWEIQTPQVIKRTLLDQGFAHAHQHQSHVTDDVSLVELLNLPVKLVEGCYTNLKITTPDDLVMSDYFLNKLPAQSLIKEEV